LTRNAASDFHGVVAVAEVVIEMVFKRRKQRLTTKGWEVPVATARFTDVRFADDVLLYARSLEDAKSMLAVLLEEFQAVGLQLNASKTKILTTAAVESPPGTCKVEWVSGRCIHVLSHADSHKYLGRALNLSKERATAAVKARIAAAWHQFQKRRGIFMCQHVHANLRIKLFNSTVLPVMLYSLSSLTLKPMHHSMLRGARTKMLGSMAGWRRAEGESWPETMHRMRARVAGLQSSVASPCVSETIFSLKWGLARRLFGSTQNQKWAPLLLQLPSAHTRSRGRPPLQWLDDIDKFCAAAGEASLEDALKKPELKQKYVDYCINGLH